jgi:uncharacterized membrane protein
MIRCSTCDKALNDGTAYCPFCGSRQTAATPSGGAPPPAELPGPQAGGIRPNIAGALAYPLGFITGILFLNIEPYKFDPFVRFHAWQSTFLSVSYGVFFAGMNMFVGLLFDMKLGFVFSVLAPVMALARWACILLGLFTMYKALRFERFSLPLIGAIAAGLAGEG